MRGSPITAEPRSRPRSCRGILADWIRWVIVRLELHAVVAGRIRVLDGCVWRRWMWPVRTVKTTYILYAWFATADVLDIIVGSDDELDKGASCPVVFTTDIRQLHSSSTFGLAVPVLLGPISEPPPYEGVVTFYDRLQGRDCSSDAGSYAATQSKE